MADNLRIGAVVARDGRPELHGRIVDSAPNGQWCVRWSGAVVTWTYGEVLRVVAPAPDRPRLLPAVVLIDDDGDRTTVSRDYCPQDDDALGVRIHAPACDVDWWLSDDEAADLIAALQRVVEAP